MPTKGNRVNRENRVSCQISGQAMVVRLISKSDGCIHLDSAKIMYWSRSNECLLLQGICIQEMAITFFLKGNAHQSRRARLWTEARRLVSSAISFLKQMICRKKWGRLKDWEIRTHTRSPHYRTLFSVFFGISSGVSSPVSLQRLFVVSLKDSAQTLLRLCPDSVLSSFECLTSGINQNCVLLLKF